MPGRQSHGRSLMTGPSKARKKSSGKSSKARSQKNALNAFGIAQEMFPVRDKKTPRFRELDADIERKHGRDDDGDGGDHDDDDYEQQQPQRKRAKGPSADDNADYGSDSEGNEWRMGGLADDDEDSEIDNDQGETLGEEAIDLATALDQWEESSEEEQPDREGESSSEDSGSDGSDESESGDEDDEDSSDDGDDDDEVDPAKLEALRGMVSSFAGEVDDADQKEQRGSTLAAIDLGDLGLSGVDPSMKKAVKQLKKEEKRPEASKRKVDVPLARREQGRLDRSAAYEKTTETLNRWTETVKQNRRAEHLTFPLPETTGKAGLDMSELQPLTAATASSHNELESAILSIMDQSGLSMDKPKKEKTKVYDDEGNELSQREAVNLRRRERELAAREAKRAARVKKIKSKAYHRVHRRQSERDAIKAGEDGDGPLDSEEEREAQDRRRALERVGQRHRDSKWAKMGGKAKRAVWDDDFRSGLNEMARRDEELRRRKEGKTAVDSDDETSSSGSDGSDDESGERGGATLRRQIDEELRRDEEEAPAKGVMAMAFMRKAEAARRKELEDLRDSIAAADGDNLDDDAGSDDEASEVGRRQYGAGVPGAAIAGGAPPAAARKTKAAAATTQAGAPSTSDKASDDSHGKDVSNGRKASAITPAAAAAATPGNAWAGAEAPPPPSATGPVPSGGGAAWSTGGESRRRKKDAASASKTVELDLTAAAGLEVAVGSKKRRPTGTSNDDEGEGEDEDEADNHLPLAIRDQGLLDRAFAHDDVELEFAQEKQLMAEDEDDKVVDETIPGWGSWVGDGISERQKKRNQGRFLKKVEGIKQKNRQDAKLDKVMINEKRNRKNDRYLATQLPHPFESRQQYERSLRLPMGPEWQTKQSFQDSTKPRVLMKQGVITPISKPTA
ncbi:U3 small nucleolar RNA-associated protein 14 [Geosmithia morbida]|uniref:U3 small nucleolar RNA-associated protein 14 n=1 Tax=Geosmithia morbida TaxID=1094350 RepID=A0A9P5D2X0_9HYPO|nr:U3 small nucleolar RNA-associated protein 14 [Geosmithia morbida]KAF4125553.1 U3 small nucleolar RNA-associated protein 14 [Geosmithia morbida]